MFTKEQIEAASAKVKSGTDYPQLVQDFKTLGIKHYEHIVADGSTIYHGGNNHFIRLCHVQQTIAVADISSAGKLKHALTIHQQGQTDYQTFCMQAGEAGVEKWVSDLVKMTVTYLDKSEQPLLIEAIPDLHSF